MKKFCGNLPKIDMASGDPPKKLCFFGNHLLKATTALTEFVDCNDVHTHFLAIDDLSLRETIMARCCMRFVDEDAMICSAHQRLLGYRYYSVISGNKRCLWPSHNSKKRIANELRDAFPETNGDVKKQSFYLFSTHGLIVPYQSRICPRCRQDCVDKLKNFEEEAMWSPEPSRKSTLGFGTPPGSQGPSSIGLGSQGSSSTVVGSQASSGTVWSLPDDEKRKALRKAIDDLLDVSKIKISEVSHLKEENTFEGVSDERKRQLKNYAGAAVASVVQAFVKKEEDGLFWKELKDSKHVEKYLHSESPPSEYMKEIILTNNNLGNYQRRVEYFSTVLEIPGITPKLLLSFNSTANRDDDSDDESDKVKVDAIVEAIKKLLPEGLLCNPPITRHILNEAIRHRKRHGYGGGTMHQSEITKMVL